jgi:hypothetical protein
MRPRWLAGALIVLACGPKAAPPPQPAAPGSRAESEHRLRTELESVAGDACAHADWLATLVARSSGLDAEVGAELEAEQRQRCRLLKNPEPELAPRDAGSPALAGGCNRARAEAELKQAGQPADRAAIDAGFARCFADRVQACQLALDADVDEGLACWKAEPWPDAPAGTAADAIERTAACLGELAAVVGELRACGAKPAAERDGCTAKYAAYAPAKCPLLDPERGWRRFPLRPKSK